MHSYPPPGAAVDAEGFGQQVSGAELAQVEHGGQDSVGRGQLVPGSCSASPASIGPTLSKAKASTLTQLVQSRRRIADRAVQPLLGHPGQYYRPSKQSAGLGPPSASDAPAHPYRPAALSTASSSLLMSGDSRPVGAA
ncbi:hypothetical protein ADK47_14215 [Streptomyces rimosus subsp. rimosus]|nr:hypothetical protein ADK78_16475 [Kitasatospora aureofaciens]KOT39678.1 hypothetical protein ADK42_15445 [Streptomyces rimosus subsp. rimosus]KOT39887.1 hypothetical protein ADK84_13725 [Streptomyces sp. NRRL WC-3701]KOT56649.1 hypothetical protein ADK44_23180 [Streptomyces rimosus subsp. rimosus]KOT59291.1 hypothetical protein ADK45_22720 [Streptomyces rimosus subsp. rimosus]